VQNHFTNRGKLGGVKSVQKQLIIRGDCGESKLVNFDGNASHLRHNESPEVAAVM
jgi:hypothetical protein